MDSGDPKVTKLEISSSGHLLPQFVDVYIVAKSILILLATF